MLLAGAAVHRELYTRIAARIGEGLSCLGDELPVVTCRVEGQLQHPESVTISHFTIGDWRTERIVGIATHTNDNLANATLRVGNTVRVLPRKSLVVMLVASEQIVAIAWLLP